jgi:hypothetical protein
MRPNCDGNRRAQIDAAIGIMEGQARQADKQRCWPFSGDGVRAPSSAKRLSARDNRAEHSAENSSLQLTSAAKHGLTAPGITMPLSYD